ALLPRAGFCEEARAQAQARRHLLGRELHHGGVVGGGEAAPVPEVELEQSRPGLGVHGGQRHAQTLERANQLVEEPIEPPDLVQAVADATRQRGALLVPDPDLVLDGGHHLVAEIGDVLKDRTEHLSGRERPAPVGPARGGQAHAPAGSPGHLAERVGLRLHDEVGSSGSDAEPLVVRDGCIDGIESVITVPWRSADSNASGRSALPRIEPFTSGTPSSTNSALGGWPSRELASAGLVASSSFIETSVHSCPRPLRVVSEFFTRRSTSAIVAANRSTICPSSSSPLVNAGARSVWSPAYPSACECVEVTSRPCSSAMSSTHDATSRSTGRKDRPSRGSTSSTPRR